jgi:hypothetical protein
MMAEEEAKKTWCPFARFAKHTHATLETTVNRDGEGNAHPKCLCLGSGCGVWKRNWENHGECGMKRYTS